MNLWLCGFWIAATSFVICMSACAASKDEAMSPEELQRPGNVDLMLLHLRQAYEDSQMSGEAWESFVAGNKEFRLSDGRVAIDAVARNSVIRLRRDLEALGAVSVSSYGLNVSCFFPIEKLHLLESVDELKFARPALASTRSDREPR